MANKFKLGDRVVMSQKSEFYHPKTRKDSNNPIDTRGKISSIYGDASSHTGLPILVDWDNKTTNSYNAKDLILIKTNKMAARKKDTSLELSDGQYFTALYGKKNKVKIRGIIKMDSSIWSDENEVLLCNKGFGEESEDCGEDTEGYSHFIEVVRNTDEEVYNPKTKGYDEKPPQSWESALADANVTDFKICEDKRQIAIIDKDVIPEYFGHKVMVKNGRYEFGCGAVSLTKKQVQDYVKYREIIETIPAALRRNYEAIVNSVEREDGIEREDHDDTIDLDDVRAVLAL